MVMTITYRLTRWRNILVRHGIRVVDFKRQWWICNAGVICIRIDLSYADFYAALNCTGVNRISNCGQQLKSLR